MTTNKSDNEIATAGAQLSSLQSKDSGVANTGQELRGNMDNFMMPRRESIGVVNVLGDALFNRRTSLDFGGDMDFNAVRRGSMDSVVDAAIQNLANRRLSMLGGSTHASMNANSTNNPMGNEMPSMGSMGGNLGMMGMQAMNGLNGMNGPMGMNRNGRMGMSTMNQFLMDGLGLTSMMTGNNNNNMVGNTSGNQPQNGSGQPNTDASSSNDGSTNLRQNQLQQQRLELQRRQKELELQRQQLLSAMEERKQAMQQMQESIQRGAQQPVDRRLSLFGGALTGMPFPEQMTGAMDRRGSFGGGMNQWPPSGRMRDERRGSLDLLVGAITQESEMNKLKNNKPDSVNPSSGQAASTQSGEFTTIEKPIPLGLSADKDWLTPLHCFVRLHCVEVFTATKADVAIPTKGKRKPIQIGQVGIRCPHCHNSESGMISRERGSVYYPTR